MHASPRAPAAAVRRGVAIGACFAFFDAVLVSDEAADELRGVIRERRRTTPAAPWLYGVDEIWNKVVSSECKMWFNPSRLKRNKEWYCEYK